MNSYSVPARLGYSTIEKTWKTNTDTIVYLWSSSINLIKNVNFYKRNLRLNEILHLLKILL